MDLLCINAGHLQEREEAVEGWFNKWKFLWLNYVHNRTERRHKSYRNLDRAGNGELCFLLAVMLQCQHGHRRCFNVYVRLPMHLPVRNLIIMTWETLLDVYAFKSNHQCYFLQCYFFFTFLFFSVLKTHWTVTPRPNSELYNNLPQMFYVYCPLDIWDCDLNKVVFPVYHFLMFKLKSCVWISEGFNELKKTLVTCVTSGDNKWQTSLPLSLWNGITQKAARPKPLNLTTWLSGRWRDASRRGDSKKKATPALFAQLTRKVAGLQTLQTALSLAASIQPLPRNVWQNQEPKCRKRRVDIGRRVVRWTHPAGLPSTVHGSW